MCLKVSGECGHRTPQLKRNPLARNGAPRRAARSLCISYLATLLTLAPALDGQTPTPMGTYVLVAAGSRNLPVMISRIVPGEGTTLHSARLNLLPTGALHGEILVSFTDSGTVADTILVEGRWEVDSDSVRLTYQWSRPRWQGGQRDFETGHRSSGTISQSGLDLRKLAYFDQNYFGAPVTLHFRRVN